MSKHRRPARRRTTRTRTAVGRYVTRYLELVGADEAAAYGYAHAMWT
jgi:hypothetical protein